MRADPPRDPRRYVQVADLVREQIADGALRPGDPVPSFTALQHKFGYSRPTIAKAIRLLAAEGLIRLLPGLGYYVR